MNHYLLGVILLFLFRRLSGIHLKPMMVTDTNDKGFSSIENAKSTLAYYIRTLDEIKGETSRKDQLKIRFHLPVLRFYLASIDKLNLDSVGASKSVKFTRRILCKYAHLVDKKLYGRLSAKLIGKSIKSIKNLTKTLFDGSVNRTKGMYDAFWDSFKLKRTPNDHLEVDGPVDDEEFDLT